MKCTQCAGRSQRTLCKNCTGQLGEMLAELDWLLRELEVTAGRRDKLTVGAARGADSPPQINFNADEVLGDVGIELQVIVSALGGSWAAVSPRRRVRWLRGQLDALSDHSDARRHFRTIQDWSGLNGPGPIHDLINRPERRFAGDCPECGELCGLATMTTPTPSANPVERRSTWSATGLARSSNTTYSPGAGPATGSGQPPGARSEGDAVLLDHQRDTALGRISEP